MSNKEHSSRNFPDLMSLLLGAVLTAVALITVYFVVPNGTVGTNSPANVTGTVSSPYSARETSSTHADRSQPKSTPSAESFSGTLNNYSSDFQRGVALYDLANRSTEDSLVNLIDEVRNFEYDASNQDWKNQALSILVAKLVHVNSNRASSIFFDMNESENELLAYVLAHEWASIDLDGALDFVANISVKNTRISAANGLLDAQSSLPMNELEKLAMRFDNEEYMTSFAERKLFFEEAKNPEKSWNELAKDPSLLTIDNYERVKNIGNAWIKKDGAVVIPKMTAMIRDQDLKHWLRATMFDTAARLDVEVAFEVAVRLESYGYYHPARTVMSTWAEEDPLSAWERISAVESTQLKEELTDSLFSSWSSSDAQTLIDSLGMFPTDVQDQARESLIWVLADTAPDDALAIYNNIGNDQFKVGVAPTFAWRWATKEPKAALDWALNDASIESGRFYVVNRVISEMTDTDYETAFEITRSLPMLSDGEQTVGLEASVISDLAFRQLDKALSLLPTVRKGYTQFKAYTSVVYSLRQEARLDEAIELGQDLKDDYQVRYYTRVGSSFFSADDPESIFSLLEKIPSNLARSRIATRSISDNNNSDIYDDEQIDSLKEYLTTEDQALLQRTEQDGTRLPNSYWGY